MTRAELIERIAERNPHLYHTDIDKIVSTIFDEIANALLERKRVELRGFGVFTARERPPRAARNPRTGESVRVGSKIVPFFKTGKRLKERINVTQ